MQHLTILLSRRTDPKRFEQEWTADREAHFRPAVNFYFREETVDVRLHTNPRGRWEVDQFKRAFAITLHRVTPTCQIERIEEDLSSSKAFLLRGSP